MCVGGAALTGYNGSAEGTITAHKAIDIQYVHPQTGYSVWFLPGRHPSVDLSHQVRIRTTFTCQHQLHPVGDLGRARLTGG